MMNVESKLAISIALVFALAAPQLFAFPAGAQSDGSYAWSCEENPGIQNPVEYNYLRPQKQGEFTIFCSPENVWDQITAGAIAGSRVDAYLPVEPGATEFPKDVREIIEPIASRHDVSVVLIGSKSDITPEIEQWFKRIGCSVSRVFEGSYESTYAKVSEEYFPEPKVAAITTFNPISSYLGALLGGPAFAIRFDNAVPEKYVDYLLAHKQTIERIYLVDVGDAITEEYQPDYPSYGNLKVPQSVEDELKSAGFSVERISGAYEEDVSINCLEIAEDYYLNQVEEGKLARMPQGITITTSMKSEWCVTPSLVSFAIAKEFFLIEGWNDVRGPDGRYSRNCDSTIQSSERRDNFNTATSDWISGYLGSHYGALGLSPTQFNEGCEEFAVAMATNWYGENQIDWAYQEQTIPLSQPDVAYHEMKIGGAALDDALEAWQERAISVICLERFKFPPMPWIGETVESGVDNSIAEDLRSNLASGKKALMVGVDFEDYGGCLFNMQRLFELADEYGIKYTCALTSDLIELFPDYLLKMMSVGNVEFGTHALYHELMVQMTQKTQNAMLTSAYERQVRYLGNKPLYYCPPCGLFNEFSITEIEGAGFKYAFGLTMFDAVSALQPILGAAGYELLFFDGNQLHMNGFDSLDLEWNLEEFKMAYYNLSLLPHGLLPTIVPNVGVNTTGLNKAPYILIYGHSWNLCDDAAWQTVDAYFQAISEEYIQTGKVVPAKGREIQQFYRTSGISYFEPVLDGIDFENVGSFEQADGSAIQKIIPGFEIVGLCAAAALAAIIAAKSLKRKQDGV